MNLDEKLREIVAGYAGVPEYNNKQHHQRLDEVISGLKQAFEAAGYVYVPQVEIVTRYERGKKPELFMINGQEVMTGQEWLAAFKNELKNLVSRGNGETWMGWDCGEVLEAARRASGLTEGNDLVATDPDTNKDQANPPKGGSEWER